jgi:hypothetical protein
VQKYIVQYETVIGYHEANVIAPSWLDAMEWVEWNCRDVTAILGCAAYPQIMTERKHEEKEWQVV